MLLRRTLSRCPCSRSRRSSLSFSTGAPLSELDREACFNELPDYFQRQQPVVLRGLVSDSRAVAEWPDLDVVERKVGPNVVCDVEIGSYNAGERLTLDFEAYVAYLRLWKEQFEALEGEDSGLAPDQLLYLAQNDLHQFGRLGNDLDIPSFCTDGSCGQGQLYQSMLWMGPRGCVSPLHFDPLDNILLQIVGRKRVTILPRDADPSSLYIGETHEQQYNTSAVDIEQPDYARHERFGRVSPLLQRVELRPGDGVYIPAQWWHHVRSLDLSMSVNVWWR